MVVVVLARALSMAMSAAVGVSVLPPRRMKMAPSAIWNVPSPVAFCIAKTGSPCLGGATVSISTSLP